MTVHLSTLLRLMVGYPALEDDEKRKAVWLANVPLGKTHELRAKINNGQNPDAAVLDNYEPTVIAAAVKLYLLELPGTLLSPLT